MKRAMFLMTGVLALCFFVGCASKEDKANKLINEYMYKTLHDYKSYEAVETTIDTLYNLPITDEICRKAALDMAAHGKNAEQYRSEAENAERAMKLSEGAKTPFLQNEHQKATRKYNDALKNQMTEAMGIFKNTKVLMERVPALDGKTQVGWLVNHSFRCNNKGGNSVMGSYVFLIDKQFKTILNTFDLEDEDVQSMIGILSSSKDGFQYTEDEIDAQIAQGEATLEALKSIEESL